MRDTIEMTITYDHPVKAVWEALTNKEAMSAWLMPCDMKPEVGHRFQCRTKPNANFNGVVDCQVLELVQYELLSFSWSGGPLKNTKVTFKLESLGNKTQLYFKHSGFKGFLNKLVVRKILSNGWRKEILPILLLKYLSK